MRDPHLKPYLEMLKSAFPDEITESDRLALQVLLLPELSERNFGALLGEFLQRDRHEVLGETIKLSTAHSPSPEHVRNLQHLLQAEGWDFDSDT